ATRSGATLTGGTNASGTVYDSGTVTVTVNGHANNTSFGQSSTTSSIASSLASAINGDSAAAVTASSSGSTLTLISKVAGSTGNYSVTTSWTWNTGSFGAASFTASGPGSLTGGTDAGTLQGNPYITLYSYDALGNLLCVEQHGAVSGTGCSSDPSNDAT